jgi:catechol-2,3-dioxygenase
MLAARLIVHPTIAPAFLPVKARRDYYPFTMAFTLDRLDHLVLTVANIDATVDFYTEVLGMEAVTTNGRKSLTFGVQTIKLHQRGHEFNPRAAHPMPLWTR